MSLPITLKAAFEELTSKISLQHLHACYQQLSDCYRNSPEKGSRLMESEGHRLAYLSARFPATYSAVSYVLQEMVRRVPDFTAETLLDVGSGPGTSVWAAQEVFYGIKQITLLEKNKHLIKLGKELAHTAQNQPLCDAEWIECDLQRKCTFSPHDLIIASYVIGELEKGVQDLIVSLWKATKKAIVFIEPGTPRGFSTILNIREILLNEGAHIVAPCPHQSKCPMAQGDWCHFSQRIPRTSEHRIIKSAELNYEDEKFSYIIASKEKSLPIQSRILRHPIKRPGHINFKVCQSDGIKNLTVSRKQKERWRNARKAEWGEDF
ncbi:MAG TPA: small ribosomal subunit Rsm22 family protein [Rhabdochlamydiaceae bacterium]|nr:small ribosomal subunit Rsm22 family protein [Rhabdochlamydiaceae bacterium]